MTSRTPSAADSEVCAVILSYDRSDVMSMIKQVSAAGIPLDRIVIVHNAGPSQPTIQIDCCPVVVVNTGTNLGYGHGMNVGMAVARQLGARYILLCTPELEFDPRVLLRLVDDLRLDTSLSATGPVLARPDGSIVSAGGRLSWLGRPSSLSECTDADATTLRPCTWLDGAIVAVRASCPALPEQYFLYYEDVVWGTELSKVGTLAVDPQVRVTTSPGASVRPALFCFLYWRNRLHYLRLETKYLRMAVVSAALLGAGLRRTGPLLRARRWREYRAIFRLYLQVLVVTWCQRMGPPSDSDLAVIQEAERAWRTSALGKEIPRAS